MTTIHAGAQLDRAPGPKYVEALHFAELALAPPLPRAVTLSEWRSRMPEGFVVSLVAPRPAVASSSGPMRMDEELEAGLRWLSDAAAALDARVVVVPTDADTTTGQRDRDRIAAYFDRLPRDARKIVWAPAGLWEQDVARPFAARHGIELAFDALEDPVPVASVVYGRLRAIGGRQRFSEGMLEEAVERIVEAGPSEAFVAISSPRSFKEATRLAQIVAASTSE